MPSLAENKYLSLTTFRKDGRAVSSPVWSVDMGGGAIGFWTSSGSGKVKRLGHTDRVSVQPCDARGRITEGTKPVQATAKVVTGAELTIIQDKVRAKYGFMTKITKALATIGGFIKRKRIPYGDIGVVVTPTTSAASQDAGA